MIEHTKELLELAAKAAEYRVACWPCKEHGYSFGFVHAKDGGSWNPLTNDSDALRLAVRLELLVHIETCYYVVVCKDDVSVTEHIGNDGKGCIYEATRRAIVRAAAEIGKLKRSS